MNKPVLENIGENSMVEVDISVALLKSLAQQNPNDKRQKLGIHCINQARLGRRKQPLTPSDIVEWALDRVEDLPEENWICMVAAITSVLMKIEKQHPKNVGLGVAMICLSGTDGYALQRQFRVEQRIVQALKINDVDLIEELGLPTDSLDYSRSHVQRPGR